MSNIAEQNLQIFFTQNLQIFFTFSALFN